MLHGPTRLAFFVLGLGGFVGFQGTARTCNEFLRLTLDVCEACVVLVEHGFGRIAYHSFCGCSVSCLVRVIRPPSRKHLCVCLPLVCTEVINLEM